jgi:two-component system response regulator NreC
MIRVLIADDHVMFRDAISDVLTKNNIDVIATAADGREAAQKTLETKPSIAILDIFMPLLNGLDAARLIAQAKSDSKVILISGYHDERFVLDGLRVGARGYIRKERAAIELVRAIREVAKGGVYLSPDISGVVADAIRRPHLVANRNLSVREREVLQLVAEGKSTKEIATILGVSIKTADHHRERLMRKLDLHHVAGLTRYAVRQGLVMV